MDKIHNKSTEPSSHSITDRKSLLFGGIVVLLIAISPILFYSYRSFPVDEKTWETSYFTITTLFPDFNSYAWYFTGKFIPLYLLLLWFFTCKHWWHWIILVPIAMYSFQLWGVVNQSNNIDELELAYIFPLMMILVPAVYLIRARLFNSVRGNSLETFEEDLLTKKSLWAQIKDLFR